MPVANSSEDFLEVGYVAGAHGLHGEVRIKLYDRASQALQPGRVVHLFESTEGSTEGSTGSGAPVRTLTVTAVGDMPGHPGRLRVQFEELGDRDDVLPLKGCAVRVQRADLEPLHEDEFYLADVIGLPVQRRVGEQLEDLGRVVGIMDTGAQDLLEVEWVGPSGRAFTWLIPAAAGFVLDVDAKRVLVDPPPGMLPEELEGS